MPRNTDDKRPINRWAQLTTFNRRLSNSAATVILALLALPQLQTMLGLSQGLALPVLSAVLAGSVLIGRRLMGLSLTTEMARSRKAQLEEREDNK
ncbi:MAG: hypothetical protein IPH37_14150 [Burkholderiales bacterium]|nr:hypothetical protein [Burkholderiales bacterium]